MQSQLPAHLANRHVTSLTARASDGMGSTLPPHISIKGNTFTFIDGAGQEYAPMPQFLGVVIDISDGMNKRYYDKPYDPRASTYEPPACWSANGIAPSREATIPQAATCGECPQNVRGSAVSRISNAPIKACRDEKWLAILIPQMNMIFQLVVTPGSFKTWKSYTETLINYGVELSLIQTHFSFQPGENGVLLFGQGDWVDAPTADMVEASAREKKTDAIVGRNDQPRVALAAPVTQPQITAPVQAAQAPISMPQMQVVQQAPQAPFTPAVQPAASVQPQAVQGSAMASPTAQTVSPSDPQPRRRRRTAAEMAGERAGAAPGASAPQIPQAMPMAAPQAAPAAPFPVAGQPAPQAPFPVQQAPAAAPAQFGMAPGAPVNPEMMEMLAKMGFTRNA